MLNRKKSFKTKIKLNFEQIMQSLANTFMDYMNDFIIKSGRGHSHYIHVSVEKHLAKKRSLKCLIQ